MPDRTDPANWPSIRGPWHEVTDISRLYDFGMPWCVHAARHPDSGWRRLPGHEHPSNGRVPHCRPLPRRRWL
jgi:hypothetical protein